MLLVSELSEYTRASRTSEGVQHAECPRSHLLCETSLCTGGVYSCIQYTV